MAEYIDLNNTEVLAEAGENAKLVVEEDGELKRIPASAVGQVKTVNGVEPDEAGNVVVSGLPEGMGPLLVTANTTNGTDYTFSHTGNEIAQHISMGGNAVMNDSDGTVGLCYGYYMAISSNGSGQTPYIAFGVLAYANSKPCLMLFLVPMDSTAGMSQMFALETYTATPT